MGLEKEDVTTETPKATIIERRHKFECAICRLLDSDDKNVKFHVYEEGLSSDDQDMAICNNCLLDIMAVKKMVNQKIDNPKHDTFKNWVPSFVKDMPGVKEAFLKILC